MSKSETYIFTTRGRWFLLPAFKCFPWRTALPDREMSLVSAAARKVARLLWCLHASLPEVSRPQLLHFLHILHMLLSEELTVGMLEVAFEESWRSLPLHNLPRPSPFASLKSPVPAEVSATP